MLFSLGLVCLVTHQQTKRMEYLQLLAAETHLGFHRLGVSGSLSQVLTARSLTRQRVEATDLRWVAGCVALLALVARYARPMGAAR